MIRDIYPAAHAIAPRVHEHFARHSAATRRDGTTRVAAVPDPDVISTLINAAFWASLRREESYVPTISLAYLSPEQDPNPLLFEHALPLTPGVLAKIAPVVERPGIHLGVWHRGDDLRVWGTTRAIPSLCFVLEVVEPGLLVVKHARGERTGKYVNVAVLEGDQCKVIDENAKSLPDCPTLLTSLLGFDTPLSRGGSIGLLVQLAVSMRAHRRGGSLLVVPSGSDAWRESIVAPIAYAVQPPFRELASLMREAEDAGAPHLRQAALREAVDAVAGLTAADGATVMTDAYELLAFGTKITRRRGWPPVEQVSVTEPIEGDKAWIATPPQLGGTRHLSAAQFVHDQHDALALVASQDRQFTIFAWSPCEERVHAHRVEALLL